MKRISNCIVDRKTDSKAFKAEKGKTFTLNSENQFYFEIIAVDKCVFVNSELRRCDYLFLIPKGDEEKKVNERFDLSKAYYVELKGDSIRSACEQLYNAIDKTKNELLNFEIFAKVIGTKGFQPNLKNNDYYQRVRRLIKKEIEFHKVHKGNNFNHIEII